MADRQLTKFDYLLNSYTAAAQHEKPATQNFKTHHDALYAYVRDLERRAAPAPGGEVTIESIRAAGGIVHGDGNIFFTNIAQLRASLPAPTGWQPIETCPLDTMVIFGPTKRMSGPCIGMHHSRDGWVTETPSEWASIYPPKEWMPLQLPAAPSQDEGKTK